MALLTPRLIDPSKAAFVVVDMETTGLSLEADVPLEIGIGIFDDNLKELAMNSWLIRPDDWQGRLARNEYVKNMHTENGLISDILALPEVYYEIDAEGKQNSLDFSMPVVAYQVWLWLTNTCDLEINAFPMTGSSIGSLDRPFMREFLGAAHGFFTYRSIDVSSVKELCKKLNADLYRRMQLRPEFLDTNKKHRVRDDVRATVTELKFYVENFLRVQPSEITIGQLPLLDDLM